MSSLRQSHQQKARDVAGCQAGPLEQNEHGLVEHVLPRRVSRRKFVRPTTLGGEPTAIAFGGITSA